MLISRLLPSKNKNKNKKKNKKVKETDKGKGKLLWEAANTGNVC